MGTFVAQELSYAAPLESLYVTNYESPLQLVLKDLSRFEGTPQFSNLKEIFIYEYILIMKN